MRKSIALTVVVICIITTVSIIGYVNCSMLRNQKNVFFEKSFSGVVKKIQLSEKQIPTVEIENVNYNLGVYSYQVSNIIKIEDSLVKQQNSMDYMLFRKDSLGVWQLIYGQESNDVDN